MLAWIKAQTGWAKPLGVLLATLVALRVILSDIGGLAALAAADKFVTKPQFERDLQRLDHRLERIETLLLNMASRKD